MLSRAEIAQFVALCASISDKASSEDSRFVTLRHLLGLFRARLVIRPLLVEGMIASQEQSANQDQTIKWTVLVDEDKYKVEVEDIENESSSTPLPDRLRNTVAHELVHTLAFSHSEFGVKLSDKYTKRSAEKDLVRAIEAQTEKLSPLLLLSQYSLDTLSKNKESPLTISEVVAFRKLMAVSRYVLITRLGLLKEHDPFDVLQRPFLRNVALGLGSYNPAGIPSIHKWPFFINFDRNIVPEKLFQILKSDKTDIADILESRATGRLFDNGSIRTETRAGASGSSSRVPMEIEIMVEKIEGKEGRTFFFLIRKS